MQNIHKDPKNFKGLPTVFDFYTEVRRLNRPGLGRWPTRDDRSGYNDHVSLHSVSCNGDCTPRLPGANPFTPASNPCLVAAIIIGRTTRERC